MAKKMKMEVVSIHISGLVKLETATQPHLDTDSFRAIIKDLGRNCRFDFQSITTHPKDPNIVGYPLRIQVYGATSASDKDALTERLTRTFTPPGYNVTVEYIT